MKTKIKKEIKSIKKEDLAKVKGGTGIDADYLVNTCAIRMR